MIRQNKRTIPGTVYGSVRVLSQLIILNCFSYSIGINGILILTGADHQAAAADLVDHAGSSACGIQDSLCCICIKYCLAAPSSLHRINFLLSSLLIPDMW